MQALAVCRFVVNTFPRGKFCFDQGAGLANASSVKLSNWTAASTGGRDLVDNVSAYVFHFCWSLESYISPPRRPSNSQRLKYQRSFSAGKAVVPSVVRHIAPYVVHVILFLPLMCCSC